jgi:uncharacterized protein YlxW (UPF0749 family)
MARGWESKSVEEQRSMIMENPVATSSSQPQSEDDRRAAQLQRASRTRQRQALDLQRENILSQRTSNPSRRAALEAALAQIESRIQALG